MKKTFFVYTIIIFGLAMAAAMPTMLITAYQDRMHMESKPVKSYSVESYDIDNLRVLANKFINMSNPTTIVDTTEKIELAIADSTLKEEPKEEVKEETKPVVKQEEKPVLTTTKSYNDMTTDELISAIANGMFAMEYSNVYNTGTSGLTKSKGVVYYNDHKETYYSERVLPGSTLNIPGRHVANDGTVRDKDGYISVAANGSYLSKGSVVKTSLGPGKVYDSGCAWGTIDIYTNW